MRSLVCDRCARVHQLFKDQLFKDRLFKTAPIDSSVGLGALLTAHADRDDPEHRESVRTGLWRKQVLCWQTSANRLFHAVDATGRVPGALAGAPLACLDSVTILPKMLTQNQFRVPGPIPGHRDPICCEQK